MSVSLIHNECYKRIRFNNNLLAHRQKCMRKPRSHLVSSYVGNCATLRTTLYIRDIFFVPLARTASSSSLKSGFSTFCIEKKFDVGDWKELCGATGRHRLANNREITRRFCLFSGVSLSLNFGACLLLRGERPAMKSNAVVYASSFPLKAGERSSYKFKSFLSVSNISFLI